MKKTSLQWLLTIVALFCLIPVFSQEKIKFGRVSMEDLKMKRFEPDTTASAVILFDKGHFHGTTGRFVRHVRIKVLTNAGTFSTNFQVATPTKSAIDGITFNLEGDQVTETHLERSNIYKEEIIEGNQFIYKIFFPNVKPGSVVDLQYQFDGLPLVWRFQDRIPVVYSELILEPTKNATYKKTFFGKEHVENVGDKWFAKDVPAFIEEPLMSHYLNYVTHFKIDLERLSIYEFSTTWQQVGERLMGFLDFGEVLNVSLFLNAKGREIRDSKATVPEKINMAVRYIQENMKWNGWTTAFATRDIALNFKKNHSGNSAEINLLLIALLRKAGITTYPAILSTRDNGLLNPASASLSSVNYVVGYIKMVGYEMLVDATDPVLQPGMLPVHCRNVSAYVITPPFGEWLDTSLGKSNSRKQYISLKISDDGQAVADISNTYQDYDFTEWLKGYKEFGSPEAYVANTRATAEPQVHECSLKIDSGRLKATEKRIVHLTNTEYVEDLGSEMVLNPFIFSDIENPFKNEYREHPIDFLYPRTRSIIVSIDIPSNYTLRATPESIALRPEHGGARFSYQCSMMNNVLTIQATLQVDRQIFPENEYAPLRNFFMTVNKKLSEPIQIDKKL